MKLIPFKLAVYLDFIRAQKKFPNIKNPQSFAEKIQWIK